MPLDGGGYFPAERLDCDDGWQFSTVPVSREKDGEGEEPGSEEDHDDEEEDEEEGDEEDDEEDGEDDEDDEDGEDDEDDDGS
jgi:segregation and condensation protein B